MRPDTRNAVASMIEGDSGRLISEWCGRLNGLVWAPRVFIDGEIGGLVAAWLQDYHAGLAQDLGHAFRAPDEGAEGWVSGSHNPRVEIACRIEVLSLGRDVIEEYLNEHAFPALNLDGVWREEILDDLEGVFRVLAHQRIQDACEMFLRETRPAMRG